MSDFSHAWIVVAAAVFSTAATGESPPAAPERKVALVIGNAAYKGSPLVNPVNDARDISARLTKLGFDVILKTDVGQREMSRAVTQFGQRLKEGSTALVYYAGHGIQSRGRNFLVPVDAEIAQESSIRSEAIDMDQILEQLQPARVSVVILDACRNNPFERRFRSGAGGGLAQMDAPKGTLIAYATAPGKVALDGDGRNGLYTAELLKALNDPDRRVEDVFKQVRNNVARQTDDRQIPWESSSLTGDLYFARPTGGATAAAASAATAAVPSALTIADPAAFELEFWRSVEKDGRPEDYRAYLDKYPNGQFAELARIHLHPAGDGAKRPDAVYAEGFAKASESQCKQAVLLLRHAAEKWPDHANAPAAWQTIARCETAVNRKPHAKQAIETLVKRYPNAQETRAVRQFLRNQAEKGLRR
ncbi:MAG: caspase family protein [Rhodocyclaceae bacterium]|nr:caspase family protein [Rhodocyclaceae bacterium]